MKDINQILRYFPNNIYHMFMNLFSEEEKIIEEIREIRFRTNRPIILKLRQKDIVLQYNINQLEMLHILEKLCENSIYAYKNQICEGFITVKGGHRVGLTGSCVIENGKILNVKYISSLNFRIAREVLNCSTNVLREIIDIENNMRSDNRIFEILYVLPENLYQIFTNLFRENIEIKNEIQEIRIRANRPIILKLRQRDIILNYNIMQSEILQILERLCENSVYAYKDQICNGFITIKGGHRIGLTGSCVIEKGKIINVKYISSLNFRIAREVPNCSTKVLKEIVDIKNKTIYNTIIVAPPGKGKTTILRDLIRRLSNGIEEINFEGKTCGVVDERGEIAAMFKGIPQNDIGLRTDIIENVSKDKGIHMLIRTMAPQIIACDEIGSKEDIEAIRYALYSGVKGIFTMHGKTMEDVKNNKQINNLVENKEIEKIVFLA